MAVFLFDRTLRGCCAAMALAAPWALVREAHGEVLEITPAGDVVRRDGPAVTVGAEVTPIAATPAQDASPQTALEAPIMAHLAEAGARTALSPQLLEAVAWVESHFNQNARSRAGAVGVMQLMPGAAAAMGVNAADTSQNIRGGATYLQRMLDMFDGDLVLALAAYNAGPAAVQRYHGVPPYRETRAYIAAVLDYMAASTQKVADMQQGGR